MNGRLTEAIAELELASAYDPDLAYPYHNLYRVYLSRGELDDAEQLWRGEFVPRLGFDEATRAQWDGAGAARFQALREGDRVAYEACCARFEEPTDWLVLADTARAIQALEATFRDVPRYESSGLNVLWLPELDGVRQDPHFRQVLSQVLAYAGLPAAELRRAPGAN